MRTHQFLKTAQLRLLEIVEFAIKAISIAKMCPLPLMPRVLMQCKSVVVQLEAKNENMQVRGIERLHEQQNGKITLLDVGHQGAV